MEPDVKKLWKDYIEQRSAETKEELIVHYISLVQKIANKVSYQLPDNFYKDDLFSYGIFGLIEAIERFNPDLGIPFAGYASKRIKGAMLDGIRKEDWVPVTTRKKAKMVEQAFHKLETAGEKSCSDEDVAAELNISVEEYRSWLSNIQYITLISLDDPVIDDDAASIKEVVRDDASPNPLAAAEDKEIKNMLAKAIGELPEKERTVVSLFYYNDLSNKEIAQVLDLSDSRVSQLHTKAIFRLRGKLARFHQLQDCT
ncbi:MAG: FliA/WhiG family RNA polymerase sigma factor [Clostridia bacterium]|jgi:RNA polymerase sigma factor for flagellar operon FliA|nr:FliA/WhiG family RNA polymerase sigma factor [Clostridia bacterium]